LTDDALAAGAEIGENALVTHWGADNSGVSVHTADDVLRASRLVITAGPWAGKLLAAVGVPLKVMRQVVFWLDAPGHKLPEFPVFMADLPEGCFYGIPATDGRGVKVARHYGAPELFEPEQIERSILLGDELPIRQFLRRHLPAADGPREDASVCTYTLTPDRHFVIDRHPEHDNVAVACGFSGHGFKFAPVIGEILADLVDERIERGPELFGIGRFANQ
jgi:sarcosine oxidase